MYLRFLENVNVNSGTPRGRHYNSSIDGTPLTDWMAPNCNPNYISMALYKGRQQNEPAESILEWSDWGNRGSVKGTEFPDDALWHYYEEYITQNAEGEIYPSLTWDYAIGMMELQNVK